MKLRYGVLGFPIKHSLSPAIHAAAFKALGKFADYDLIEVERLNEWFPEQAGNYAGLSLTMPLKEQCFDYASYVHPTAELTHSINTMIPWDGGWRAYNTDPVGIAFAMYSNERFSRAQAVTILGAGATARSAAFQLSGMGIQTRIWSRRMEAVEQICSKFDCAPELDFTAAIDSEFVISTLPMGVLASILPSGFESEGVILDVGYRPWPTPAVQGWLQRGEAISGLKMLIGQAVVAQRIFNFGDPDQKLPDEPALVAVMESAALRE